MAVDPRHLKEARKRISDAREEHYAAQRAYLAQCRAKAPGLEKLDGDIQRTVTAAIAAALRQGVDPAPAVEAARRENLSLQKQRLELLQQAGIDPAALEETPFAPGVRTRDMWTGGCADVSPSCALRKIWQSWERSSI